MDVNDYLDPKAAANEIVRRILTNEFEALVAGVALDGFDEEPTYLAMHTAFERVGEELLEELTADQVIAVLTKKPELLVEEAQHKNTIRENLESMLFDQWLNAADLAFETFLAPALAEARKDWSENGAPAASSPRM